MTSHEATAISRIVDRDREDLLAAIAESVRIPSVKAPSIPGMPFGEAVHHALEHALGVGERLGFQVGRLDGYAGWIDYGQGEDLVGVLSHVDVVPVGNEADWDRPPYAAETADGMMYGRGTADDKGPLFSSLYGLKALRDTGWRTSKRIRILIGTDEESGWGGIKQYLKSEEIPTCGFSPDGMFTVVNREKGGNTFRLVGIDSRRAATGLRLVALHGGTAPNNVPDEASACLHGAGPFHEQIRSAITTVIGERVHASFAMELQNDGDTVLLTSKGRSAHAMCPEKGINAVAELLHLLVKLELEDDGAARFAQQLDQRIGFDTTGASLGMDWCDDASGSLTVNLGQVRLAADEAVAVLDIRSPVSFSCGDVLSQMHAALNENGSGIVLEVQKQSEPLYVPADDPLIQTLSRVYHDVTGREPILHAIGGGTYARAIRNCVCFGAVYPGEEITVHRPNERASIDEMVLNAKVYGHALYELSKG